MALRPSTLAQLLASVLLAACLHACGEGEARRPNVVLVSIDTLRADHLSCYGYGRATSPGLDRLAAGGVLFERTIAPTSWTLPSHVSMLTGLEISAHGIAADLQWGAAKGRETARPPSLFGRFLPELLSEAGYRTGGFYSWKYLEPTFGFGPGFEVYERLGHTLYSHPVASKRLEEARAAGDPALLQDLARDFPELCDPGHKSTPEVLERARAWIAETRAATPERPFFCFVHLFDVHDPYLPPPPFDTRFDPDYAGPIDGRGVSGRNSPVRPGMDARDLEHLVALYDGEIAYVDAELGLFLDGLAERGLAEDTLVIVTSDHGEEFYEHGRKLHGHQLYLESVHVPWILSWPGELPVGLRIPQTAGLVDLAPTVLGLLGLSAPEGLSGSDLAPVVRGRAEHGQPTYLTELYLFDAGPDVRRQFGLHRGRAHDLLFADNDEPFRLERFDAASNPLGHGTRRARDSRDAQQATAALEQRLDHLRALRHLAPERPAGANGGLTESDLAELQALGYFPGDEPPPAAPQPESNDLLPADAAYWNPAPR